MTEQISEVDSLINSLNELHADTALPKNVRIKIDSVISTLREDAEMSIKANKALNDLDEISNDSTLQAYTRTQIWNIMSSLERLYSKIH